ncbi:Crp/Fnr family transcriptional regulator [Listeria booriae]|uniref:Crp/Fnr family transcriptional regulator n=1 Tax=Listeria booriae TaxID=1552123 RepID=UPI00162ACBCF|nr:Crp/Fnr family transcriptional regulator [Listeria booriae]MBC1293193.1 Crp/Fnr family transcriptional regulator [Listeria booriae]
MTTNDSPVLELKKGEFIKEYGEYAILHGYIVCRTGDHFIKILREGHFIITETTLFGDTIQFQAQGNARITRLPMVSPSDFLQKQNQTQASMIQALTCQLNIYALPVKQRIMALLYQIACEIGICQLNNCYIPTVMTQVELAKYAHCTREYLNGVRKELIESGWLATGRAWTLKDWRRWKEYMNHPTPPS